MSTLTNSTISLKNLRFHAYHGVLPQERTVGNDYVVNIRLTYDFSHAMATDQLSDTVNYAEVYALVRQEMLVPSQLLEHVAGRIGKRLLNAYPQTRELQVDIDKLNPPFGADCDAAGVSIHLKNDKT